MNLDMWLLPPPPPPHPVKNSSSYHCTCSLASSSDSLSPFLTSSCSIKFACVKQLEMERQSLGTRLHVANVNSTIPFDTEADCIATDPCSNCCCESFKVQLFIVCRYTQKFVDADITNKNQNFQCTQMIHSCKTSAFGIHLAVSSVLESSVRASLWKAYLPLFNVWLQHCTPHSKYQSP